jgi:hypothetical protein
VTVANGPMNQKTSTWERPRPDSLMFKLQRDLYNARVYSGVTDNAERRGREVVVGISKLRMIQSVVKLRPKLKIAFAMTQLNPTFFKKARSRFACPGPSTIPVALFPNAVPIPSAPTTG